MDLLYFQPYVPKYLEREIFQFLRKELPFYRVEYNIRRGGVETHIKTPRYTTVFGVDQKSRFDEIGDVVDVKTGINVEKDKDFSKYAPRVSPSFSRAKFPIPDCLKSGLL